MIWQNETAFNVFSLVNCTPIEPDFYRFFIGIRCYYHFGGFIYNLFALAGLFAVDCKWVVCLNLGIDLTENTLLREQDVFDAG